MADTHLTKTFASAGNRKTFTISVWLKQSQGAKTSTNFVLFSAGSASNTYGQIRLKSGYIQLEDEQSGSVTATPYTDAHFVDPSAWYHLVVRVDTTQSGANDRVRFYRNGSLLAANGGSQPSQNQDLNINNNIGHAVGTLWRGSNSGGEWHGNMAQFIFCDGQSYAPSSFATTDSTGIWKPNSSPSITYGSNGFRLDFKGTGTSADASGFGADTSGNNNHFASNNLGTNPSSKDSPTNNFATFNSQDTRAGGVSFSNANLKVVTSGSNRNYVTTTQAFTAGKWYMECRFTTDVTHSYVGFCDMSDLQMDGTSALGNKSQEAAVGSTGYYEKNNSVTNNWAGTFAINDILGLCLDCDNKRFTLSKNGQFADGSGNYDEANPTAYISYTATTGFFNFAFGEGTGGGTATVEINTGNAPFTISSANADANGYGSFEYAVPSGYYALCTKNMAQYGG